MRFTGSRRPWVAGTVNAMGPRSSPYPPPVQLSGLESAFGRHSGEMTCGYGFAAAPLAARRVPGPASRLVSAHTAVAPFWRLSDRSRADRLCRAGASRRQSLADRQQFPATLCVRFRAAHFELLERIEHDLRRDQPGTLLVVGRNDAPRRILGARGATALLVGDQKPGGERLRQRGQPCAVPNAWSQNALVTP